MLEPQVEVYPMGLTGKQYRTTNKLPNPKRHNDGDQFAVNHKFKCIKKVNRLAYLRKMVSVVKSSPTPAEIKCIRASFNSHRTYSLPMSSNARCYVCPGKATIRHHVIPLANGGRNKRNNIVPLCHECHCKVHPHMQRKRKNEAVASRHSVQPKINGPLSSWEGIIAINPARDA